MKAAVIEKQGGIENIVYRDFPDPTVGPRDVLVRCKAVGLNYFDIFVRKGMPGLRGYPAPMRPAKSRLSDPKFRAGRSGTDV
jgi:alcohol dehydrogenase